jgi:hypothetical protein
MMWLSMACWLEKKRRWLALPGQVRTLLVPHKKMTMMSGHHRQRLCHATIDDDVMLGSYLHIFIG